MYTVIVEQATTTLFSGWDWIECASMAIAMEKFMAYIAKARLNSWTHIYVEDTAGVTVADWHKGD